MKRFTSFLISLLLATVAMAQSETTFKINPTQGSFLNSNGSTVTSGYAYKWQSSATDYSVTITAAKDGTSKNNMDAAVTAGFSMWVGAEYSTYTFSFADCQILSYSFKFKSNATGNHITVTPTGGEAVTSTDEEKTLTVSDVNASSASIQLSGSNYAILVTELTFTVMTSPFTSGSVYHFQNIGNTDVALGASALTDVAAVTSNSAQTAQQWYCEKVGDYYTFRNLSNGKYLKGNGQSAGWSLSDDYSDAANKFNLVYPESVTSDATTTTFEGYTLYSTSHSKGSTGGGGSMHRDDGNNIVGWGSYNSNTRWTISAIEYTEEELTANWNRVTELTPDSTTVSGYQKKLEAIFTDVACTTLNDAYTTANMTDDQLAADTNYSALPTTLQNMVKKVRGGDWSEKTVDPAERPNGNDDSHGQWTAATTWENDYAKRFRVQMYEPYSVEGEITTYLGFNAHCNMDNPTGIYANTNQAIYIMVEGDIEDGAELWLAHQAGNGATSYYNNSAYTELHEGLNVVPYFTDGCQMWINYVVHTYNGSGTTIAEKFPHKLSDYKPLKIHIEGGYINGYFNAMGDFRATDSGTEDLWGEVDNDEDWDYYKARAALANDFALLGHRQTLLFPFGAWDSTNGYFGVANDGGGIDKALAYWLENIQVPDTTNCYGGSGNTYGDFSDTYYPGMNLDKDNGKINIMLEAWDRIMYSEHATMGLLGKTEIDWMNKLYPGWTAENTTFDIYNYGSNDTGDTYKAFCNGLDYSDYYNHHGAAVGAASGYMSGGWRVCNYHYNTMGSIIGEIAVAAGPTWGPAHEIGHQHQRVFNLNGQTEVTNNFFSNVAVWYMGMGTSRYNGSQGSLSSVLDAYNTDGNDLYTNNIWAITHLYYRLWLYYHLAGNNTQFWPRLFELCRQIPIVNGGQISGETSLLRFYQHACTAAGEDLTEFFRAHGYFELMTNRLVGDYSNATYNITEEQIETAITAVEAEGYPKNYAILLINDGTSDTTVKHNGTSKRALWDGSASAEYGSVTDFIEGNTSITTAYDAVVSADGTVTMSGGEGGVGFLVFNEDGELVSFSNKSTFELSDEAAYLLATGKATIVAVDAENNTEEAEVDLSAIQREMLGALIAKIGAMPIDDGSYRYIGFYTKSSAQELLDVLESAKTVYASNSGYGAAYEMLYTAKEEFVNSQNLSYVPFDPDLTYIITSYAYGNTMHLSSGAAVGTGIDEEATTSQWQFKTTGTDGVYKLYNVAGYYLTTPAKSAKVGSSSTESDGATFSLIQDSSVGAWTISLSPAAEYTTLHDDSYGKVVGWESGVNASKWYLKATTNNSSNAPKTDALQALVSKTDALVNLVGEISYTINTTPVALQTTNTTGDYYVRTNATNTGGSNEGPIANLVDGATNNYFHTQWANKAISDDNLDHYIEVNMGSNALTAFNFSYTTRSDAQNDFPQVIKVYGSNIENTTGDESEYVLLAEISSGLPKTAGTLYNSSAVDGGIAYQYLRFMVPTTNITRKNETVQHNYWHMAEFDISAATASATALTDYSSISADIILTAYNAVNAAKSYINYANVTDEQITSATSTLQDAYDALKDAYDAVIQSKKDELEALADATDILVNSVGSIERSRVTALALTTDNLYCNAPYTAEDNSDYSAEYVSKLIDGSATTFLHTDYSGAIAAPHYLRVYLGESSTAKSFKFNYTTRDNGNNCPTTILIEGSNEAEDGYSTITTLTAAANGLPNPEENLNGGVAESFESSVISMGAAYKYIRFKVTGVEGGNATFFVMSEFGFSAVEDIVTIEDAFEGIVSEDLWLSTYHASGDSHTMAAEGSYATLAQVEAQIVKLTEAKAVLEAAMNQVDKSALAALIEATTSLKGQMYETEITYTANEITLQNTAEDTAGYIYCNAPGSTNNYDGDNVGVDALLDAATSNFLHTTYYGDDNADDLDHYLRVDLGEAKAYIQFRYTGRSGYPNLTPSEAVVEATNVLDGEWTPIATLTDLAQTTNEVSTGCLGNGDSTYRYWRFMVTATHDGRECDGHPYFALSAFNVDECTDVVKTEQLKYTPNIYIYVTDDLVTEVTDAIAAATEVNGDEAATQAAVNAAVDALQPVHDKLAEALKFAGVPVKITTDEANPILYNIISKRATDGSKVLQYCEFDATNPNTVSVSDTVTNSSYQAWYFMESAFGVTIKPFNGEGKVLGADNTSNGHTKVWAVTEGAKSYYEWKFIARTDGYYNIQAYDGSNYFSNNNGVASKMGFWSGEPDTDTGSLFKFVDATFENDNARYYQLSDFENTLEYQTSVTPEGTTVGAFTNGAEYSAAYSAASTLIEAGNTSDAVACKDAYTALRTASATVARIEPEAGKIYRIYITPGLIDSRAGASMRIGDNGKLACGEYSAAITDYYFAFEYDADGNLYMKSLHSGTYLDEALANSTNAAVGADAESIDGAIAVAINTLGASGDAVVVGIVPTNGAMLNCAAKEGDVVAYNNTAVDKASAWVIEEVTEETVTENIKQSVTLTESNDGNKYSTLYLGYNATIPEGVTASIVTGLNSIGQLILEDVTESITGGEAILPAKTAVVLSGDVSDAKEFAYAETEDEFDTSANILRGTAYTKYVACGDDCADSKIYMLAKKSGRIAFYWAYANRDANGNYVYVNADNEICESTVEGAHKNHNKGGYVKCNANKSYLQLDNGNDEANQAAVAMFGFFFGGNTTDIDSINAVAGVYEGSVFDLQGRKLDKVTEPGIYIVNGKKVFVQEVE